MVFISQTHKISQRDRVSLSSVFKSVLVINISNFIIGIVWFRWRGWDYSLQLSQMMIRPKSLSTKTK